MSTASMGLMRTIARTTGRVGAARLGRAAKSVGLAPSPAQALGHMGLSGRAGTASTFAVSAVRRKSTKPRLFEASSYRQKTTNAAAVEVAGGEHYALDPELGTEGEILELPKKVTPEEAFESLGLHRKVVKGLTSRGFTDLFPIQKAVLGDALAGRDLIARARTGTGKTLAFTIPIIEKLLEMDAASQEADETLFADAPEHFLDAIMSVLMRDPVKLPSSGQVGCLTL